MKNKYILFLIIFLCLFGCERVEKKVSKPNNNVKKEEKISPLTYHDDNNTPISFYQLNGNTLTKTNQVNGNYNALDDIFLLQIYPSTSDTIQLSENFGTSFYEEFLKYNQNNNIKIGFSISYTINGESINYNILTPNNTMDHWEQFMAYLYDDYFNRGKGFYSHIENDEYTDTTLFTSIKLQCGAYCKEASNIKITVFTYDSEDDFLDNNYRGNSQSTISICLNNEC